MESKELYRTFIAIPVEIPQALIETLDDLKNKLTQERIRWVDPGQMHITLHFLGDIPQAAVQDIRSGFQSAFGAFKRTDFRIFGLGTFGHRSELKVLWAGIEDEEIFHDLHATTQRMLGEMVPPGGSSGSSGSGGNSGGNVNSGGSGNSGSCGSSGSGGSGGFRPHLTVARMKRLGEPARFRHELARFREREFGTCVLEKVVFFRSVLNPTGAAYEVLDTVLLE